MWVLLLGILINISIAYLFYWELHTLINFQDLHKFNTKTMKILHDIFSYSSVLCFIFMLPTFLMSILMNPGHLEKKYDFIQLCDTFI